MPVDWCSWEHGEGEVYFPGLLLPLLWLLLLLQQCQFPCGGGRGWLGSLGADPAVLFARSFPLTYIMGTGLCSLWKMLSRRGA